MGAGNTQGGMSQPAVPIAFDSSAEPRNPAMLPYGNSDYMTGGQSGAKYPGQEGYVYPDRVQMINPHTGQVSQNQAGARWTTRGPANNSYNWAPGQFEGFMQGVAQTQQQMQAMNLPQVNGWNAQNLGQAGVPQAQAQSQPPMADPAAMAYRQGGTRPGGPMPALPPMQSGQFNPYASGVAPNPYLYYALMASMAGMR